MAINVELLKKVRKIIVEEPKRLRMTGWGRTGVTGENAPSCGTVCCLAGWIILAQEPKSRWKSMFKTCSYLETAIPNIPERAVKAIGINWMKTPFYHTEWKYPDVIAWIDQQIASASAKRSPRAAKAKR